MAVQLIFKAIVIAAEMDKSINLILNTFYQDINGLNILNILSRVISGHQYFEYFEYLKTFCHELYQDINGEAEQLTLVNGADFYDGMIRSDHYFNSLRG